MEYFYTILSVFVGLGLAAAAGFRVFVPMLVVSAAAHLDMLPLTREFAWLGTTPALVTLAVATVAEVAAYYIPFVDNLLDAITSPLAVVAGTILTAAVMTDVDPLFKWSLAVIAGGGMAGMVQAKTVMTRGISSATTAGLANPIVATVELGGAVTTALVSVVMPLVAFILVFGILVWMLRGKGVRSSRDAASIASPVA